MKTPWLHRLAAAADDPIIIDGATGTRLEALGVVVQHPLWSSSALLTEAGRALTQQVHSTYIEAGAELIIANTHNLSAYNVARYLTTTGAESLPIHHEDVKAATRRLNVRAVELAQAVAGESVYVAGCLASPDQPYATKASLTPREVADRLEVQYDSLWRSEPDLIIFEMLTTKADLEGVTALVARHPRAVPIAIGIVAGDQGPLGFPVVGAGWDAVGEHLAELDPSAVFVQCTPADRVEGAIRGLAPWAAGAILGAYANDGGYDPVAQAWSGARTPPDAYAALARRWYDAGARIIGGCCGTEPAHIRELRRRFARGGD